MMMEKNCCAIGNDIKREGERGKYWNLEKINTEEILEPGCQMSDAKTKMKKNYL